MFKDGIARGRRILVTGGGTGLGKGIAEKFLALGGELFICGRRKSVCDETAAELMARHAGKVTGYGVDIRDPAAVDKTTVEVWP
jgi:NAD(P)-dependent dehydrogenase (short-subunit alcohol dehydrogenase family)